MARCFSVYQCEICGEQKPKANFVINGEYSGVCEKCARLPERMQDAFVMLRQLRGTPFSELDSGNQMLVLSNKRSRDPRIAALSREIACGDIPFEERERQKAGLEIKFLNLNINILELKAGHPEQDFTNYYVDSAGKLSCKSAGFYGEKEISRAAIQKIFRWAVDYLDIPFWWHDLPQAMPQLEGEGLLEACRTGWRLEFADTRGKIMQASGYSRYSPEPVCYLESCLCHYYYE